ncbi:hypothetical protein MOO44_03355 [Nicoliella spurrieriana]|uniref:Lipoprotein n=1 Tax=Nicoliella spurrieriana TaxID=2925830 RepID=A0A976X604_9LACO|nr:hypothetical protein [Nicoliella spurrieriana]UQS87209.1 hypothetical protein MOO44_03355 [Nicoliella spurrieriana]
MKTYQKLIPVAILGLLLAGCGSKNNDNQNASMKNSQSTSVKSSDKTTSSKASSSSSASSSSAASSSDSVASSSSSESASSATSGNPVSSKTYASREAAKNSVGYQSKASTSGLPTVNLGSGITGVKDAGAGQVFVSFNMGRWSLTVRGTEVNVSDTATPAAKQMVAYLQTHTLPVPDGYGHVSADIDSNETTVKWQEGATVHKVSGSTPEAALQAAIDAK